MQHPTRSAFGEILGHPTKPNLRFFTDTAGGGGGGGTSSSGGGSAESGSGDGGKGGESGATDTLSTDDAKAIRATADKSMRERNQARDDLAKFTDLGATPEQIAEWKAAAEAKAGGPTPEQIAAQAKRDADKAANERFSTVARTQAVKAQAAVLGFHNPAAALAMLDQKALADVAVDADTYEADPKAVTTLLEALASAEPYLVKPKEAPTVDYRAAGIGGTGSSTKGDVAPGTPRLARGYATNEAKARAR